MELSRLNRFSLHHCRGFSQMALMLAMLLAAPTWFSTTVRAGSDETPQEEVKKCAEVMACPTQGRRREAQPTCSTYFRSGCCLSQACLARRNPAPDRSGHRLSDELLAPLIC